MSNRLPEGPKKVSHGGRSEAWEAEGGSLSKEINWEAKLEYEPIELSLGGERLAWDSRGPELAPFEGFCIRSPAVSPSSTRWLGKNHLQVGLGVLGEHLQVNMGSSGESREGRASKVIGN